MGKSMKKNRVYAYLTLLLMVFSSTVAAQQIPDTVETRPVQIWSEGARMSAVMFLPAGSAEEDKLPTILMAHGWGGVAAQLVRDAVAFAEAGYLVVTFDYRGWADSDGRLVLDADGESVREVREVVDPVDMLADWQNALHWLHGEPQVDADRIGLWGSSQSGGYVVEMAIRDPRVRAVHSQVGSLSGRQIGDTEEARRDATRRARGDIGYPESGEWAVGNLRGAPIASRFYNYSPVDNINDAGDTPLQFVLAENEELFDNRDHGLLAYERYEGPKRLVVIPDISHYGIYREAWQQSSTLALEWFDQYLK